MKTLKERFYSKVDNSSGPDSCWPWMASCVSGGYGQLGSTKGKANFLAHRLAWEFANGSIPEGMQVLHKCDNRKCCNPNHLFLGTQKENMHDMISKGRKVCRTREESVGEASPQAKLTWEIVRAIRKEYEALKSRQVDLARKYGISQPQISTILIKKSWWPEPRAHSVDHLDSTSQ